MSNVIAALHSATLAASPARTLPAHVFQCRYATMVNEPQAYQSQYLLTVRAPGRGGRDVIVDASLPVQSNSKQRDVAGVVVYCQTCWSWPGIFAHLANDGMHDQQADRCNSQLQRHGHLHAIKV